MEASKKGAVVYGQVLFSCGSRLLRCLPVLLERAGMGVYSTATPDDEYLTGHVFVRRSDENRHPHNCSYVTDQVEGQLQLQTKSEM